MYSANQSRMRAWFTIRCGNSETPSGSSSASEVRTIVSASSSAGFQNAMEVRSKASSMISLAKPKAWKVSTERAWMPSAWPISRRWGRRSMMRVWTSGNIASWAAAIMPAGPEPTISTSISSGSSAGRSRPMPAATWTRGFVET
ncbi:Uncharacterised protein [Streptococcus pneumoniae]|nr:Uncharacterised protein [Streptococcus pneumoniae]